MSGQDKEGQREGAGEGGAEQGLEGGTEKERWGGQDTDLKERQKKREWAGEGGIQGENCRRLSIVLLCNCHVPNDNSLHME